MFVFVTAKQIANAAALNWRWLLTGTTRQRTQTGYRHSSLYVNITHAAGNFSFRDVKVNVWTLVLL